MIESCPFVLKREKLICEESGHVFAVSNPRSSGHHLNIVGSDDGSAPSAVLVLQRPFHDVRDDLHVAVRVSREAAPGGNAVIVDDAQRSESHVPLIVVVRKRKGVITYQPAEVSMSSLGCFTNQADPIVLFGLQEWRDGDM